MTNIQDFGFYIQALASINENYENIQDKTFDRHLRLVNKSKKYYCFKTKGGREAEVCGLARDVLNELDIDLHYRFEYLGLRYEPIKKHLSLMKKKWNGHFRALIDSMNGSKDKRRTLQEIVLAIKELTKDIEALLRGHQEVQAKEKAGQQKTALKYFMECQAGLHLIDEALVQPGENPAVVFQSKKDYLATCIDLLGLDLFLASKKREHPQVKFIFRNLRTAQWENPSNSEAQKKGIYNILALLKDTLDQLKNQPDVVQPDQTRIAPFYRQLLKEVNFQLEGLAKEIDFFQVHKTIDSDREVERNLVRMAELEDKKARFARMLAELSKSPDDFKILCSVEFDPSLNSTLREYLNATPEFEGAYLSKLKSIISQKMEEARKARSEREIKENFTTSIRAVVCDSEFDQTHAFFETRRAGRTYDDRNQEYLSMIAERFTTDELAVLSQLCYKERFVKEILLDIKSCFQTLRNFDAEIIELERTLHAKKNNIIKLIKHWKAHAEKEELLREKIVDLHSADNISIGLNATIEEYRKKIKELESKRKRIKESIELRLDNLKKIYIVILRTCVNLEPSNTRSFPQLAQLLADKPLDPQTIDFITKQLAAMRDAAYLKREGQAKQLFGELRGLIGDEQASIFANLSKNYPVIQDLVLRLLPLIDQINRTKVQATAKEKMQTMFENSIVIVKHLNALLAGDEIQQSSQVPIALLSLNDHRDAHPFLCGEMRLENTDFVKECFEQCAENQSFALREAICPSACMSDPLFVPHQHHSANQVFTFEKRGRVGFLKNGKQDDIVVPLMEKFMWDLSKVWGFQSHFAYTNVVRMPKRSELYFNRKSIPQHLADKVVEMQIWNDKGDLVKVHTTSQKRELQAQLVGKSGSQMNIEQMMDSILISILCHFGDMHGGNFFIDRTGNMVSFDNSRSFQPELLEFTFFYFCQLLDRDICYKKFSESERKLLGQKLELANSKLRNFVEFMLQDSTQAAIAQLPPGRIRPNTMVAEVTNNLKNMIAAFERGEINCLRDLPLYAFRNFRLFAALSTIAMDANWGEQLKSMPGSLVSVQKLALVEISTRSLHDYLAIALKKFIDPKWIVELCNRTDLSFDTLIETVMRKLFEIKKPTPQERQQQLQNGEELIKEMSVTNTVGWVDRNFKETYFHFISHAEKACRNKMAKVTFKGILEEFTRLIGSNITKDELEQFSLYLFYYQIERMIHQSCNFRMPKNFEGFIKATVDHLQIPPICIPNMDVLKNYYTKLCVKHVQVKEFILKNYQNYPNLYRAYEKFFFDGVKPVHNLDEVVAGVTYRIALDQLTQLNIPFGEQLNMESAAKEMDAAGLYYAVYNTEPKKLKFFIRNSDNIFEIFDIRISETIPGLVHIVLPNGNLLPIEDFSYNTFFPAIKPLPLEG